MRTWTYPAHMKHQGEDEFVVVFRDIPQAITGAASLKEALSGAEDALADAILKYLCAGTPPPRV